MSSSNTNTKEQQIAQQQARIAELEAELDYVRSDNRRLEKITNALIYRVEEGGFHERAFHAFEHSVQLADKVNEQTLELQQLLHTLQETNTKLAEANKETNSIRQQLTDAIESIDQPMVLLDPRDRVHFFNSHFRSIWPDDMVKPKIGDNYYDLIGTAKRSGAIRRALPMDNADRIIYQFENSTWYQITVRDMRDGGRAILFNDISAIKAAESDRFERIVRRKNKLLQSLIDSIQVGILLLNKNHEIEFWNQTFLAQAGISNYQITNANDIAKLQQKTSLLLETSINQPRKPVQIIHEELVVERNAIRLLNGQVLLTFTDITSQYKYSESLLENEIWMRTITDNVPALIAYIDSQRRFAYTNQYYRTWYGLSEEDCLGVLVSESHLKPVYSQLSRYMEQVVKGQTVVFLSEERDAQGELGYLQKVYVPHFDKNNDMLGHFVMAIDVTEQVNTAKDLEQAKATLEERVKERTKALNQTNQALYQAVESKTKFLAALSHDLLQPLSAAMLFAESLSRSDSAKTAATAKHLTNSLVDLDGLIETLIELSKLDAGRIKPNITNVDSKQLCSKLATEFEKISPDYEVTFRSALHSAVIETDEKLLNRILRNLLSNAFKYGAGSKVLFATRKVGRFLHMMVMDQGIGISESEQQVIFTEFKRLENRFNYGQSLGLGLSIVDKMATLLKHPISLRSEQGKGSAFTIKVPISTQQEVTIQNRAVERTNPLFSLSNRRVWHVDNHKNVRIALIGLFERWGCELESFESIEQCELLNPTYANCDLLLLDYHLTEQRTGLDEAERILQDHPNLVIFLITANRSKKLIEKANHLGVTVVHKPVNAQRLNTLIKMALN